VTDNFDGPFDGQPMVVLTSAPLVVWLGRSETQDRIEQTGESVAQVIGAGPNPAVSTIDAHTDQPRLAQDSKVIGQRRQWHAQAVGEFGTGRLGLAPGTAGQLQPHRIANRVQHGRNGQ
jgi:hypothetical protein